MRKVNCVFLIGFILFLNLFSLNSSFSSQSTNLLESASESAEDPLIVGTTSLGYDLDPILARDSVSIDIIDQVWEGLYAHNFGDPRLRIIPRLAADCGSWNEDATEFNVTLRSGITFHNGEAFTAADVNYTFSRLWQICVFNGSELKDLYYHPFGLRELYFPYGFNTTNMNASVGYGFIINKTIVVDDLHVSFKLNFPYSPFQSLLCFRGSYIMDESSTNTDTFLTFANVVNNTAIGTGPFKIIEHSSYNCTFEYWEDYYRGTPAIKEIEFVKYSSSTEISKALLAGDIDIPRSYYSELIPELEENPDTNVSPFREISVISYLAMNNMKIDKTYRHAINYAIDYDKIINEIYDGEASRMTSIIPPGITYHKDCEVPIFNITKSRQILIEAGYTEEYGLDEKSSDDDWKDIAESVNPIFKMGFIYHLGNIRSEDTGILIQDNFKNIGISVVMAGRDFFYIGNPSVDDLLNIYSGNYMYTTAFGSDYNDPSQIINHLMSNTSSSNYAQVNDPWLQLAMEEALTITNDNDRKALYYDIQDYVATDLMPYIFIRYPSTQNVRANCVITQPNPMRKLYIFPFSWHGVNTTFTDPYLELWCNSGSPPVLEFWPEPYESPNSNRVYPIIVVSFCFFVILSLWIKKKIIPFFSLG